MWLFRRAAKPDPSGVAADLPQNFGYKLCWVAVRSDDSQAVAKALELSGVKASAWQEGIQSAYESSVFVTPSLQNWVLAAGIPFAPQEHIAESVTSRVESLSRSFGEAQYFCTHRVVEFHVWARAVDGRLVRGFAYIGDQRETPWNEGGQSTEEEDLGLEFFDADSPEASKPGYWDKNDLKYPNEGDVMRLAGAWSINPATIEETFREPSLGLIGKLVR